MRANVSQFSHARNIVAEANFACVTQENVFESSQKHFCFKDANVASAPMFPSLATEETSQETMFQQQCFLA